MNEQVTGCLTLQFFYFLPSYIRVDFQLEQSSLSLANYKSEKATGTVLLQRHLYRKLLLFTGGIEFEGNAQPSVWEVSAEVCIAVIRQGML